MQKAGSHTLSHWILMISLGFFVLSGPKTAKASATEEIFQEVFITAGYATAFGAALGAASLSLYEQPQRHLQSIAIGASLGFIGGSILGSYMALSPMIVNEDLGQTDYLVATANGKLNLSPLYSLETGRVHSLMGSWQIAQF